MPSLVFLPTDICLYLIFIAFIAALIYMCRSPHYRSTLQKIVQQPIAVVCLVILGVYASIAAVDSVHFYASNHQVVSVLDKILAPIATSSEKSYSLPFAYHLLSAESLVHNGKVQQVNPHLSLVAANINSNTQVLHDVLRRLAVGLLWSMLLLVPAILFCWRFWPSLATPWRWFIGTSLLIMVSIILLAKVMFAYHVFGTDQVGYDVFYAVCKSIRTGLVIGIVTTAVMLPFAVLFGLCAGYFGGWLDDVIQYVYTTVSSIPGVLLISAAILSMQVYIANHPNLFTTMVQRADARMLALCVILGITGWTGLCRLIRGESMKLREQEYVLAARSMGVSQWRILWRHLLPAVIPLILITIVLDFSGLVLAEAVLSYVGVGVDPTTYSWGNMINGARLELARSPAVWWPLLASFVFMFVLVLCANLLADVVRDAFDPRLHNSQRDN